MIDEVIKGLPLHFQKENTIKFYKTLKPVIEYIDSLIENLKNQTSLLKCSGIFLDFMGERYDEKRSGRDDETYSGIFKFSHGKGCLFVLTHVLKNGFYIGEALLREVLSVG